MDASRFAVFLIPLLTLALPAAAQPFYIGLKGGVLLSSSRDSGATQSRAGEAQSSLLLRRYSVGPSFEAALPARLRLETGLLYRRATSTQELAFAAQYRDTRWSRDHRWEVPFGLRRELSSGAARPFVGAGGVWSRFHRDVRFERTEFFPDPPRTFSGQFSDSDDVFGWTGSAGVRFRLAGGLKITPELRYTRWTAKRGLPSQNQVDFFLGIGF